MEFLSDFALFFLKLITVGIVFLATFGGMVAIKTKGKNEDAEELVIKHLNEDYEETVDELEAKILDKKALKLKEKDKKKKKKDEKKEEKKSADQHPVENEPKPRLFVLNFEGDIKASGAETLGKEITAVLFIARPEIDEILIRLESPGGMVHGYGLAASQIDRIRKKQIPLTISVDKVAASGGYMMSCIANKIIAAPFAILGSIGVVAQLPNFNKLLKKNDIDFELLTAGEYKRTLTMFGENTETGREKFVEELEETHGLFKSFVSEHRPNLDINKVATGEHWYGFKALELNLIDEIMTSEEYICEASKEKEVFLLHYETRKSLAEKFAENFVMAVEKVFEKLAINAHHKS